MPECCTMTIAMNIAKPDFQVVAMAASAGGLVAISRVLGGLPPNFPAAVIVLQHLSPAHPSSLAEILSRRTSLKVHQVEEGEMLEPSVVHLAPPGSHLIVNADMTLSLTHSAMVHFVRPSADLLFNSLAEHCGGRTVAVVLTGTGRDGAASLRAIKQRGGKVIVQDEATSEFFGMPGAAIQTGDVDHILPLDEIAPTLVRLMGTKANV